MSTDPRGTWPQDVPEGNVHLWLCTNAMLPEIDRLLSSLSEADRDRARAFRFDHDRHRFISARLLLQRVLSRYHACAPTELSFVKNEYGKPSLDAPDPEIRFSLSKSADTVLLGVSRVDLGVDIEFIRTMRTAEPLVRRKFAEAEQRYIEGSPDRTSAFFEIWAGKEAYIKALGRGLSHPLDKFSVAPEDRSPVLDWSDLHAQGGWEVRRVDLPVPGYAAALCCRPAQPSHRLIVIDGNDLLTPW